MWQAVLSFVQKLGLALACALELVLVSIKSIYFGLLPHYDNPTQSPNDLIPND
jgi:hypothetical protein